MKKNSYGDLAGKAEKKWLFERRRLKWDDNTKNYLK